MELLEVKTERIKELNKTLKENLEEEKNKANRLEKSNSSLQTQVGLLETYKNNDDSSRNSPSESNHENQKPTQSVYYLPKNNDSTSPTQENKQKDTIPESEETNLEEKKLADDLKKIREDRQNLQKQLEISQQQQLNLSKEIRELREQVSTQGKKENHQIIWLGVLIFIAVIVGNFGLVLSLKKFFKR